jgi:hypothetical protein
MTDNAPGSSASPMSQTALQGPEDPDAPGMATVARFSNVIEAEMAKTRLESEGIFALTADGATASVAPHLSLAIGGVRLQVREDDLEEASAILDEERHQRPAGAITFRVASDASVLGALSGITVGGMALAALSGVVPVGGLIGATAVLTMLGYAVGSGRKRGWCTTVGCAHPLEPDDEVCPGCGAEVVETIARAEDRLEAEERVREERKALAAEEAAES